MKAWLIALPAALALFVATADAQTPVRIRGTIAALDGNVLLVKSRDGRDLKVRMADSLTVAVAKMMRFEEIKPGDYVGATTKTGADGTLVTLEANRAPALILPSRTSRIRASAPA